MATQLFDADFIIQHYDGGTRGTRRGGVCGFLLVLLVGDREALMDSHFSKNLYLRISSLNHAETPRLYFLGHDAELVS